MKYTIQYQLFLLFLVTLSILGCKEERKTAKKEEVVSEKKVVSRLSYVYDNAGLFSENQRDSIRSLLEGLDQKTTAQIVVYTVSKLNGEDPSAYANKIVNELNVGRLFINNGALIFIALEDKSIQLKIGTGLKWQINNEKAGAIVNQIGAYFGQQDYYGGIHNALKTLIEESSGVDWEIFYTSFAQMENDGQNAVGKIMVLEDRRIIDVISGVSGSAHFEDTGPTEFAEGIYTISTMSKTNTSFLLKYNRDIIPLLREKNKGQIVRLYARVTMVHPFELRVLGFQRKGDIAEV
ncbi:MAG: TPM domain-containing protein [Vicingus serpentipes]|nr:TPM domain-containing protein [Vicingus serpentipes]